jgi:hypothetical protein
MAKTCAIHKETPAVTMCRQCHKPVCAGCTVVIPQGRFCSPECGVLFRGFQEKFKEGAPKRQAGAAAVLVILVLFMVVGAGGLHWAARKGVRGAEKWDFIGRFFGKVKESAR